MTVGSLGRGGLDIGIKQGGARSHEEFADDGGRACEDPDADDSETS